MIRKTEIALLAAALAVAAPLTSAFAAAPQAQPRQTAAWVSEATPSTNQLAANGAAAVQRALILEQAEATGHGGEGGGN